MQRQSFRHVSATVAKPFCTATGYAHKHLPQGKRRDEVLGLVRIGLKFKSQQVGKRPGFLAKLVLDCSRRDGPPYSFARLLDELERSAACRELHGEAAGPVEKVDRIFELVTIHTKRGRVQVPFSTVRNHLTTAKKCLLTELPLAAKPGKRLDTLAASLKLCRRNPTHVRKQ